MSLPPIESPVRVEHDDVPTEWVDDNGHMGAVFYNHAFRVPIRVFFDQLELGFKFREQTGLGIFMLDWRVQYVREVLEGMHLSFELRLLDATEKIVHYYVEMFAGPERYLAATCAVLEIQVDLKTRNTVAFSDELQSYLAEMLRAHQALPTPKRSSAPFGIRRA